MADYYNEASQRTNLFSNASNSFIKSNANRINNFLKGALFLETFRSLAWSRGYGWYVELDGVPNPFHAGGVIGLPATDLQFQIVNGETFEWDTGIEKIAVPKSRGFNTVTLTVMDDEQATMFQFFERWWNNVYNSYTGVLPLSEACKCMSVYKLKGTRSRVSRYVNRPKCGGLLADLMTMPTSSRDLIVFPMGSVEENEKSGSSDPRTYTVTLGIASQENPDYGNPCIHGGVLGMLGSIADNSLLGRMADYL